MKHALPTALFLCCAVAGQDAAAPTSPLVFRTPRESIVEGLTDGEFFRPAGEIPALDGGDHYVLALNDDGDLEITTAPGAAPLVAIEARPFELLDLFGEEIDQFRQRLQGFMVMGAGQMGLPARDAMATVRAVFEFPAEVEHLGITVTGNPDRRAEGFETHIALTPVEGSWFEQAVDGMAPGSAGAPVLDEPGAFLTFRMAIDLDSLATWQPLLAFTAAIGAKSDTDRTARLELLQRMHECSRCSMATSWSQGGGMTGVTALRDTDAAAVMAGLLQSETHIAWVQAGTAGADVEYDTKALEHRGAIMTRSTMYFDSPQQVPFAKNGELRIWEGVAGTYSIWRGFGADEDGVRALIDAALDQRLGAAPLGEDELLQLQLRLPALLDHLSGGMLPPMDELPETFALRLGKSGRDLTIDVEID